MMAEDVAKIAGVNTTDLKIYDNKRLFRMPNSIHPKTGLYKIPISYDELNTMKYSDLKQLAQSPRAEVKREYVVSQSAASQYRNYINKFNTKINKPKIDRPTKKLDYTPPCIEYLLNTPIGEGQRNQSLAFLASFYHQNGHTEEETLAAIEVWNNNMVSPSIEDIELQKTVASIFAGNHKMGCSTATVVSRCDKKLCKLSRGGY
jgi:hypothetical protein